VLVKLGGIIMIKSESEIWREHPEIVGIEVSTLGRVRTLDRVTSSEERTQFLKGRVLKQCNHHGGYLHVGVSIDGKRVTKLVHRLVAQTFLPNPDNLPQVNHRDCDPTNNNASNLEWCNNSYNQKYREKHGISRAEVVGHPLFAINLSTLKVSRFKTQHEAGRMLEINQGNIGAVIKGRYKQTHGYWFVNADENADDIIKQKLHDIQEKVAF